MANGSHGANAVAFHGAVRSLALITPLSHPPSPPFFLLFLGGAIDVFRWDRASVGNFPPSPPSIMFTFAAFCYMLSLVLCVSLIFFAIWHVSTSGFLLFPSKRSSLLIGGVRKRCPDSSPLQCIWERILSRTGR